LSRILALTSWYPPHHHGGYEVLCRDVMVRMVDRGHPVEVLCSATRLDGVTGEDDGRVDVHRDLELYWREDGPWRAGQREQLAVERHNQGALTAALDRFRPDVVAVWHMGAISLNLLTTLAGRRLPMVYCICDDWPIYSVDLDPWSRRWNGGPWRRMAGRVAGRLTGVPAVVTDLGSHGVACVISEFTAAAVERAGRWSFPDRVIVAAGIDRALFRRSEDLAVPDGVWAGRLAYAGRLDPRKGVDTLVDAVSRLPGTRLSIFGKGGQVDRRRLSALAGGLGVGDRVEMIDVGRRSLPAAYSQADCVVFPSEWPEPFGLVPLEAMSCGTPVVATGVGGSAEYLRDGVNCLLFAPGDADALAAAVRRLAGDRALRDRLRDGGMETAAAFDVERTADGYERCFDRVALRR
jgi:glycogen(starch) synthase